MVSKMKDIKVRVKTQQLINRKNILLDRYEAKKNALAVCLINIIIQGSL